MTRRHEILLASIGSYGDVLPFLTLGETLVQRGYDVTLMTSGYFTEMANRIGVKIAPVGTAEQYKEYVSNPDWTHPIRGLLINKRFLHQFIEPSFNYLRDEWRKPTQIVVANPHCIPVRLAQEKFGISLISMNLASISLGSIIHPPTVNARFLPERLPRWLRGTYGRMVHRVTDHFIGSPVNHFRKKIGLDPIRNVMRWWHSPEGVFSLFPDWFTPQCADWPAKHECLGFPVLNFSPTELDSEIEQLLSDSRKTLLFLPGTIASSLDSYVKTCSSVCEQMDRDGIMLAPALTNTQANSSRRLKIRTFIPLPTVLPRVAAAIHHGGIGTIAACFRAGVPQLIRPVFADQPDNAACVSRLGVGKLLGLSQFRTRTVTKMLSKLLSDPVVAARCRDYQQRLQGMDGIRLAADRIDDFSQKLFAGTGTINV
jgi:rhamnosyltransferase subunit B